MYIFRAGLLMPVLVLVAGISMWAREAKAADDVVGPLYQGPYAAILGRYDKADGGNALGSGGGAMIAVGLRRGSVGFELRGSYSSQGPGTLLGGSFNGLVFPFERLPGLYATAGVGLVNVAKYPNIGDTTFNVTTVSGGAGYILPLQFQGYEFGLRAEALYQYGKRNDRSQDQRPPTMDLPVESNFHDVIMQLGLQFPFGMPQTPARMPVEPVQVVPVEQPHSPPPEPGAESPQGNYGPQTPEGSG